MTVWELGQIELEGGTPSWWEPLVSCTFCAHGIIIGSPSEDPRLGRCLACANVGRWRRELREAAVRAALRECRHCGCLVVGGPTACLRCVKDREAEGE